MSLVSYYDDYFTMQFWHSADWQFVKFQRNLSPLKWGTDESGSRRQTLKLYAHTFKSNFLLEHTFCETAWKHIWVTSSYSHDFSDSISRNWMLHMHICDVWLLHFFRLSAHYVFSNNHSVVKWMKNFYCFIKTSATNNLKFIELTCNSSGTCFISDI